MIITFSSKKFEKIANDDKSRKSQLGQIQAEKVKNRLGQLRAAENLASVRHLPGYFHELKAERKGLWSCYLDGQYRLIFKPHNDPIPVDGNGIYIWEEILAVTIIEIVDYH